MSKITNGGLTQSGTGCFIAVHMVTVGVKGLTWYLWLEKVLTSANFFSIWNMKSTIVTCVDQITVTSVQHRWPAVHLAGLFILIHGVTAAVMRERQERSGNVLMLVSVIADVLLLSGLGLSSTAIYTRTSLTVVQMIVVSHSLTSSDNVMLCQVQRDVSHCISL